MATLRIVQLLDLLHGKNKLEERGVNGWAGTEYGMRRWSPSTQIRSILKIIEHKRCSVQKIGGVFDYTQRLVWNFQPQIQTVYDLAANTFGREGADISRRRFDDLIHCKLTSCVGPVQRPYFSGNI
jgi:hypothetical protein